LPHPEGFYGLALPLGGAEISMQDLVRPYAALANNGELRPLRRAAKDPVLPNGRRILSPEAAFLALDMLGNVPRPELNCADASHSDLVFWKTGTSHGFHDAWSIAVFDHLRARCLDRKFDGGQTALSSGEPGPHRYFSKSLTVYAQAGESRANRTFRRQARI